MNALLLILIIVSSTFQNVIKKAYNQRPGNHGAFVFSTLSILMAGLFFIVTGSGRVFPPAEVLPYSIGFAVTYATAAVMSFLAINCGSLALTSLVVSYSLIIPSAYGLLFLNEAASWSLYAGIILLMISLIFINREKGERKITPKWILYAFLAFLSNGICTTVQKVQQLNFNGAYKNEFMATAMLIAAATVAVFMFIRERDCIVPCLKCGWLYSASNGIANGFMNMLVMVLGLRMAASVIFPLISAGGILATAAVAIFFYKEKLSKAQITGVFLGILAIIFLNL